MIEDFTNEFACIYICNFIKFNKEFPINSPLV